MAESMEVPMRATALVTLAVLAGLLAGCPGPTSTEIAEKAFTGGLDKAEVHR
jgi:hypothetical protein